jgi:ferrochelatase
MFKNPRFLKEPDFKHGQPKRTAVLLCNLGTPQAPEPKALRTYLAEFLGDPRVVEIPRWIWLMILHGIILRLRPAASALKYASIWTPEGSPLKVWTERQAQLLQNAFNLSNHQVLVRSAMRYGQNNIPTVLSELKEAGADRILILPAYPQYSATTTASVFDSVSSWSQKTRLIPEFRFINRYHDHSEYISALAHNIKAHWASHGRAEVLVMSFHGVPQRTLELGDPYHCECHKTARLLAESLGLAKHEYKVTFQSRFGKAKWLEPYTEPSVRTMAQNGVKSIQVVCPGFTSDCLETLEEIAMEVREAFLHEGGERFEYIACLNDNEVWIQGLQKISLEHLQGWPLGHPNEDQLALSKELATSLGASA